MEDWRRVWRQGVVPELPLEGLRALRAAIVRDSPCLIQGLTCNFDFSGCHPDQARAPVTGACAVGYCGWQGNRLAVRQEVLDYFADICSAADESLGGVAECRFFFEQFDSWDRQDMLREMLPEVEWAIQWHEKKGA